MKNSFFFLYSFHFLMRLFFSLSPFAFADYPQFFPCTPESDRPGLEPFEDLFAKESSSLFCSLWNPDFAFNGHQCCGKFSHKKIRRRHCSSARMKGRSCREMTTVQANWMKIIKEGKGEELLQSIRSGAKKKMEQSYCTEGNGFLVQAHPVVMTPKNHILIKTPERCVFFGTDPMIAMLDWLGMEVAQFYPKFRLPIGDISAPRGGCLFGRSGRRGHASHTSGKDADVGFFIEDPTVDELSHFTYRFNVEKNWWFLKKIFKNPYACIKVIFLDRRHIRALDRFANKDPEWQLLHPFIRHTSGHKNHFHVRIGDGQGQPGCTMNAHPDLEPEEGVEDLGEEKEAYECSEASFLDTLKSR